jgi:hypothetical protein
VLAHSSLSTISRTDSDALKKLKIYFLNINKTDLVILPSQIVYRLTVAAAVAAAVATVVPAPPAHTGAPTRSLSPDDGQCPTCGFYPRQNRCLRTTTIRIRPTRLGRPWR